MISKKISSPAMPTSTRNALLSEVSQEGSWVALSIEKPEETVTVLLATGYSIAVGHLGIDGHINIEFMPSGQMESEDSDLEFTHWMPLPGAPFWRAALAGKDVSSPGRQLNLWE
jgi:hypothetical protein